MSHLRLFDPSIDDDTDSLPQTVPFPGRRLRFDAPEWSPDDSNPSPLAALDRARSLSCNRTCPHCRRAAVTPLELADAQIGRGNLPIPGTGTLVGFRCECCRAEWPVKPVR